MRHQPGSHEHRRRRSTPTQARKRKIAARVYERDGWICQLCTGAVDPALVGTCQDDSPSLDHIVPFSEGGTFTITNLRLAHRLCNLQRAGHNVGRQLPGSDARR